MSNNIPVGDLDQGDTSPKHAATEPPSFASTARKAFVAAGVAGVGSIAASVQPILVDGKVEATECVLAVCAALVVAVGAFAAVYKTTNEQNH